MSTQAAALAAAEPAGEDEYDAFYAVLAATTRGRAFLTEHARRTRHAETDVLLAALKRLESQVAAQTAAPQPASPMLAEVGAVLETVRSARAQIDAVKLSATVMQLVSALETVQRRLSALLPAAPAPMAVEEPQPAPVQPPFTLALTAVAAQALAAAQPEEETVKVIKAGSMPPPVFEGEDFSVGADLSAIEDGALSCAEPEPDDTGNEDVTLPPPPDSDENPLGPLMALSEEERLALFS
jgi:hypothetical protein